MGARPHLNLGHPCKAPGAEKCLAHSIGRAGLELKRAGLGGRISFFFDPSLTGFSNFSGGYVVFVVDTPCHTSYLSTSLSAYPLR